MRTWICCLFFSFTLEGSPIQFQNATFAEASYLTSLSLRSSDLYQSRTVSDREALQILRLSKSHFQNRIVRLLKKENKIIGFYALGRWKLKNGSEENFLTHLYVEPAHTRKGYGKILFQHAMQSARTELKWKTVRWVSEPPGAGFYQKMGAKQIGELPSRMNPQEKSPIFVYQLPP